MGLGGSSRPHLRKTLHLHKPKRADSHVGQRPLKGDPEVRELDKYEHFRCQGQFPCFEKLVEEWDNRNRDELYLCEECFTQHMQGSGRFWGLKPL